MRRPLPFLLLVFVLGGCADPRYPEETGGVPLSETKGMDYLGGRPFSVSPDDQWLLFSRDTVSEPPGMDQTFAEMIRRNLEAYLILDLEQESAARLALGDDVVSFLDREISVLHWGGCWVPGQVGWEASLGYAIGGHMGFEPTLDEPRWTIIPAERELVRASCRLDDRIVFEPARFGRFQIVEPRGDRVRIEDADSPGRMLAEHDAPAAGYAVVSDVQLSPDATRLSYVVYTERFGFARTDDGYVIDLSGPEPVVHFLASQVTTTRWSADGGTLFGYARGEDRISGIYRWSFPRP